MGTLSMFNGIIIRMRPEKNMRHHKPHIHARYQGIEATFDVATRKPFGHNAKVFPVDQRHMVQAWIALREAEILANWELMNSESGTFFRINPL